MTHMLRFGDLADLFLASLSLISLAQGAPAEPRLDNGVISFTGPSGQRKLIDVGKRCADLWVAPDESVIAFIAIEHSDELGRDPDGEGPFIMASAVYIARRANDFAPVRIDLGPIQADGREWVIFRHPRVSPEEDSVVFGIPSSITSEAVFSHAVTTGENRTVGRAVFFCVEWGGRSNGSVLMQRRYISSSVIKHRCYAWSRSGGEKVVAEDCEDFDGFASTWSRDDGGLCR